MNKLILGVVLFVVACQAYDFRDEYFNQVLSAVYDDALSSPDSIPLHPRVRREENATANDDKCKKKHHHRRPKACCSEESTDLFQKEQFKACFKEVTGEEKRGPHGHRKFDLFSCEEVEKRQSDITCVCECVGKKAGFLAEDGSPNTPEVIAVKLKESLKNQPWLDAVTDKIVEKCLAESKKATPTKFYTEGLKTCNPSGLTLKHCLFRELQLNCPADQIKDQAACDKFKDRVEKGDDGDLWGPPGPPPSQEQQDD